MKTLKILFVITFVIFSGFAGNSQSDENVLLKERIVEGITVPMKFSGATIPNYSSGLTTCSCTLCPEKPPYIAHVRTGWTQGNQTHGGRLIPEQSTWEILSCNTDFGTMLNTSVIRGTNTVADGDSYYFDCIMTVHLITQAAYLEIKFDGGTGRFEGVTGQITCTGNHDPVHNVVTFSGEGYCVFPK